MARIPMFKRVVIMLMNFLFPPAAVMMLTGVKEDTLINSVLFLLAIFPSHIHAFYLSWTYFNRKRKVRKGVYPGDKASMIYSDKINNGGATRREMQKLKEERDYGKIEEKGNRLSRPGVSRQLSNRIDNWDDGFDKEILRRSSSLTRQQSLSRRNSGRSGRSAVRRQNSNSSKPASRPTSLTRQLSNRLEDHVVRRLADREDRRRRRDDDSESTEVPPVVMAEPARWR